jgi:hypothetical protein
MVSLSVLTEAPLEALEWPLAAMLLRAWLVAESSATAAVVLAAVVLPVELTTVPAAKLV